MSANGSSSAPRLRCAVYTRKSSEEGLDQEFNSLDAQREACEAYILSQASLGWKLLPDRYDDGGISGGTMERPALQRLLQDLRDRRVDVVVVYKIDRLTRSLGDFSRIVEVFEASGASFVSVTQQFNTTTSMGRLTLNVLLSFAQFEREVTAERIRDKIAASKKRGMWMGGVVPLGYRVDARKLHIVEHDAAIVRWLFDRYLELRSVRALAAEVNARKLIRSVAVRSRWDKEQSDASTVAGEFAEPDATPAVEASFAPSSAVPVGVGQMTVPPRKPLVFSRGHLYQLLANPLYIGKIRHRDQVHEGEHDAIVDQPTFDAVHNLLATQAPRRSSVTNQIDVHLLTGILFDEHGDRLRPVHTTTRGVRYRYYVSKHFVDQRKADAPASEAHSNANGGGAHNGWRLPAHELEAVVEHQLDRLLADDARLATWIARCSPDADIATALHQAKTMRPDIPSRIAEARRAILPQMITRVELTPGMLSLTIQWRAIVGMLTPVRADSVGTSNGATTEAIKLPISLKRRGLETRLILEGAASHHRQPDLALRDLVMRAHRYLDRLTDGKGRSLSEIADAERTELSEVSRILPFAFLAPRLVDAILTGDQPVELTAQRLSRIADLPLSWADQAARLTN